MRSIIRSVRLAYQAYCYKCDRFTEHDPTPRCLEH
jgi:hypothetical protein